MEALSALCNGMIRPELINTFRIAIIIIAILKVFISSGLISPLHNASYNEEQFLFFSYLGHMI